VIEQLVKNAMYGLTLEWSDGERQISQSISSEQTTKQQGTIRIGRDERQCDVVLNDSTITVSRLHVEIFYEATQNTLLLRNLTQNRQQPNPVVVDQQKIIQQETPLKVGSHIKLGKRSLKVKQIKLPHKQSQQPSHQEVYGVQCPNGHILSQNYLGDFCPHCGNAVQASETVLISPSQ